MLSSLSTSNMVPVVKNRHQIDKFLIRGTNPNQVQLIVKGSPSQSGNLQEWQNSSGTISVSIGAANALSIGAPTTTVNGSITFGGNSASKGDRIYYGTCPSGYGNPYPTVAIEGCSLAKGGLNWPCLTIYGGPSNGVRGDAYAPRVIGTFLGQANVLSYHGTSNVTLCIGNGYNLFTDSNGRNRLSGYGNNADAALVTANSGSGTNANGGSLYLCAGLSTGSATPGPLIFQTSIVGSSGTTNQTVADVVTITSVTQNVLIQATAATVVPLVVKGVASQTGDLQQWQDSSSNVLAKISATGKATLKTESFSSEYNNGNSGAAATIDWSNGNFQKITLTNNCVLTFTNGLINDCQLRIIQDGIGGWTISLSGYYAYGGSTPVPDPSPNAISRLKVFYDGTNYYCN